MPNPVRPIRRTDKLSDRQRTIVKTLKKNRLPVQVYRRGRKLSVHNPLLDVKRKAKKGTINRTKRYPHTRDTAIQISMPRKLNKKIKSRKYLLP